MSTRAARRYKKDNIGYYLDKPTAVVGGYDRALTIVSGSSDSRYAGCSFVDDDWFKYIAGATTNRSIYITDSPRSVNKCITANSRIDDDLIRRYGFRDMLPDIMEDIEYLGEALALEFFADWLVDTAKEIFETKRESFKRMYAVINEEYSPLYNLDVTYEETHEGTDIEGIDGSTGISRTKDGDDTTTHSGKDTLNYKGSETMADGNNSETVVNTSVYAFNSSNPVPESTSTTEHNTSNTKSFTNRADETEHDTETKTEYDTTETEDITTATDRTFTHGETITTRRYGNQGVTKSTELVDAELSTWSNIDFVRYVSDIIAHTISMV